MQLSLFLFLIFVFDFTFVLSVKDLSELVVDFFNLKHVKFLSIYECYHPGKVLSFSSRKGIRSNLLDLSSIQVAPLASQFLGIENIGVFVDMRCKGSMNILEKASTERLFGSRYTWLIVLPDRYSENDLKNAATQVAPETLNITEYLELGNDDMKYGNRMRYFNEQLNAELLANLNETRTVNLTIQIKTELLPYFRLPALFDSDVTLAVPNYNGFDFYEIYRKTQYLDLVVNNTGFVRYKNNQMKEFNIFNKNLSNYVLRKNLDRSLLRAGLGLLFYDYLSRSEDFTFVHVDVWAQMNVILMQTMEQDLNLRLVLKVYDDYGFEVSPGVFTGVVGGGWRHDVDIINGLLLRIDRLNAVDFVDASLPVEIGVIFRRPNLASVTNIFILPFSSEVWIACGLLMFLVSVLLWYQLKLEGRHEKLFYTDVLFDIVGIAAQQGSGISILTLSTRLSLFVLLISSLLLFTSYSTTIVALLQSPSDSIKSISELVESALEVGVENVPYLRKNIEEDTRPVIAKLRKKKLLPIGEIAFISLSSAIKRVHKGLFAFYGELSSGFEIISRTFTEKEKCDLKKIIMYLNNKNGLAVVKRSPLKEILSERKLWHREIGLIRRVIRRWMHPVPVCETQSAGYSNVTILDIKSLLLFFIYSVIASMLILLFELTMKRIKFFNWIWKIKRN